MIFFSNAYVLTPALFAEAWKPRLCWHNLVASNNLTADNEDADYPVTSLANPATNLVWKSGSTSAGNVETLFSYNDDIDYVAIGRHNLGSSGTSISIEALDPGGDPEDDGDWTEVFAEQLLANDKVAIFFIEPVTCDGIRLVLTPDAVAPQIGVLRVGKSIQLPYGMPPGHIPISHARSSRRQVNLTQGGDYAGTVELSARLNGSIEQQFLDPSWYRANLQAFQEACATETFFFAWNPEEYPDEVGYCWVLNDPQPRMNRTTGEIDITFEVGALVI